MRRFLILVVAIVVCNSACAEDWPQFLGPRRDSTSRETIPVWKGQPKVLWKTKVGDGHSSPIVSSGFVFLLDKEPGKDIERLRVYDETTGKLRGSAEHERTPFNSPFGIGPRSTPSIGFGQAFHRVYTYGVTGRIGGVSFAKGSDNSLALVNHFNYDLLKEHSAKNLTFGVSASPLVEGDLIIAPVGSKGAGVVALNRFNGKLVWKALDDGASYASPVAFGEGAKRQIVVLTQEGLVSLSPKDGSLNWRFPFRDKLFESSTTPIMAGDLLIGSSVTLGSVALKLGDRKAEQVWKKDELKCYFSTPVAVGADFLYMVTGGNLLNPTISLRCVKASSGETLWTKDKIGKYHAALVKLADDKLLMLDDTGSLALFQPDPEKYKELARSKVCGETWAHPAVANGRVFLRDKNELMCLEFEK